MCGKMGQAAMKQTRDRQMNHGDCTQDDDDDDNDLIQVVMGFFAYLSKLRIMMGENKKAAKVPA